jgi:hypothetical protein
LTRPARKRQLSEYEERFWRSRHRSEAQEHRVIHFEDGSFSVPTLPITVEALRRHAEKFGGVEEVARWHGIELDHVKPLRNEKRIREVQRLFEEHVAVDEIASRAGLHLQYLSTPSPDGLNKPQNMRSPASNPEGQCSRWDTPRKRALGDRIVRLRKAGMGPMAIADRLGKSDVIVRRYLRQAQQAGLLAESA